MTSAFSKRDTYWMNRALQLARKGIVTTQPNPRVGCVIVKDDQLVGEGWHQKAGSPHAEIHALHQADKAAHGATAYVTLEPCSHTGRTPPCADALINHGIQRVVGAMTDPNPQVSGRGYQRLSDAGIEVDVGCLEHEAQTLNSGFVTRMTMQRPKVHIKLAHSLDGRTAMASGESQWITGAEARRDVQFLRAASCAIITGCDTVLIDDPSMTVRLSPHELNIDPILFRQPLRVIIDGRGRLTGHENIFSQPGDILVASCQPIDATEPLMQASGRHENSSLGQLMFWESPKTHDNRVDLKALLRYLAELQCNDVLVESGSQLAGAFLDNDLCDTLILYCAPTLLGSCARPLLSLPLTKMSEQLRLKWSDVRMVGNDLKMTMIRQ